MSETRSGYRQSVPGLVGAVLACLALIGAIWLLSRLQGGEDVDPTPTVDYRDDLAQARGEASFDVLAPSPEPDGWRATSARWEVAGPVETWKLGFLTADDEFVGLTQSNDVTSEVVVDGTPADQPGTPVTIGGEPWQTLTSSRGETALVLVDGKVTVVVTGTVPRAELVDFAGSLSAG